MLKDITAEHFRVWYGHVNTTGFGTPNEEVLGDPDAIARKKQRKNKPPPQAPPQAASSLDLYILRRIR